MISVLVSTNNPFLYIIYIYINQQVQPNLVDISKKKTKRWKGAQKLERDAGKMHKRHMVHETRQKVIEIAESRRTS